VSFLTVLHKYFFAGLYHYWRVIVNHVESSSAGPILSNDAVCTWWDWKKQRKPSIGL